MSDNKPTNRFALWSLFATTFLLFPVGVVFAVVGLVQIARSKGKQTGIVFALVSLLISGLVAPGAAFAALYGRPRAFDGCYHVQENAVGVLRLISYLEEQHKEKHGRYGKLDEIGFKPRVSTKPYNYEVVIAEEGHFLAVARGTEVMEGDVLMMDESRQVQRVENVCVGKP